MGMMEVGSKDENKSCGRTVQLVDEEILLIVLQFGLNGGSQQQAGSLGGWRELIIACPGTHLVPVPDARQEEARHRVLWSNSGYVDVSMVGGCGIIAEGGRAGFWRTSSPMTATKPPLDMACCGGCANI